MDELKSPSECDGHRPPARNQSCFEFTDATEEELAFWNTLSEEEKKQMTEAAYKKCFFDVLPEAMKVEAEKGQKTKEQEEKEAGGETVGPKPPDNPHTPDKGPPIMNSNRPM
jgi:hypothetical protein